MEVRFTSINLKLPPSGSGSILVMNLYLYCDPYMRIKTKLMDGICSYFESFKPGTLLFSCQLKSSPKKPDMLNEKLSLSFMILRFDETSKTHLD